jgi:LacI family transcriptional regulator
LILIALDQSLNSPADEALVAQIQERVANIVCVEWQHPGLPSVTFDRNEAAAKATRHLLSLGHRNLAYIGESDQRTSGFRQALMEAGPLPAGGLPMVGAADLRGGYNAAQALLPGHPEVTAVVAGSDEVAIGILRWASDHGIEVPGRIALVSIDNIEMAEFTNPPLTTVHVEKTGMGRQAVQRLLQYEAGEGTDTTLLLPSRLIVRRSCGTPAR